MWYQSVSLLPSTQHVWLSVDGRGKARDCPLLKWSWMALFFQIDKKFKMLKFAFAQVKYLCREHCCAMNRWHVLGNCLLCKMNCGWFIGSQQPTRQTTALYWACFLIFCHGSVDGNGKSLELVCSETLALKTEPFTFFASIREGEIRCVQVVAICSLIARCH